MAHLVAIIVEKLQLCLAQNLHAASGHCVVVALGRHAQERPVADDTGIIDADVARQLCMRTQKSVLAMHRQEMLRLHQLHHLFQLFPAERTKL